MKTLSWLNLMLLLLLTVSERGSSITVVGRSGQNVTLTCKYDIRYYTAMTVCWGRGLIPNSGCSNQLISTDGYKVIEETRASSRYQLLGRLDEGDVSLTILDLRHTDAGQYGCRVEIPGWFNDEKHHFDLIVERAPLRTTSTTFNTQTSTEETTVTYTTAGQLTSTQTLLTSSPSSMKAEQENSSVTVVLVCVLFALIAAVTAGGLVFIAKRWRRLNKTGQQQQQVTSSVQFSSTSSTLQLHNRGSVVENIYQMDGGGDGGEYEYCP